MIREESLLGTRVRAIAACAGVSGLIGCEGTICVEKWEGHTDFCGVEFDDEFGAGHACDGACKDGHGRYCELSSLEVIESKPLTFDIKIDSLF